MYVCMYLSLLPSLSLSLYIYIYRKKVYLGSIFSFKQVLLNRIDPLFLWRFFFFLSRDIMFFLMLQFGNSLIISPKKLFVLYRVVSVRVRILIQVIYIYIYIYIYILFVN